MIVVGSTTRGPVGRLLVGGVGERLLAGAACPVAIAPHGYRDRRPSHLARVGVGVDASNEAEQALHAAVALARAIGGRVRLITTFQRLAFGGISTAALAARSANDAMRIGLRAAHDRALTDAGASVEVESRFREGRADEVLVEESADLDLLVVGSRGYGPRNAVLLGSTTTVLARAAPCPILVLPRGTELDLSLSAARTT